MAASIDAVPVDKLEGLLECSLCIEKVKDPRTLPCFHSYCKDCLDKYVKHHRETKPHVKDLNCPVCRTKFTLDPEGVQGMPRNHFICNMLDVMTVQNRVKAVPCSNCQEPSVGRCVTCELFMCNNCLQTHNNWSRFRDHSVLSMEELSKPENKAKIKGQSRCKKHIKKKLKFYCETCNELICRRCMDFDHLRPDHVCSSLETVAEKKLKALKVNYSILESKLSEGNEALQELTNYVQLLEDNMEKARSEINERKSHILATVERMLEEKAKSLVNEAEAIFTNKHNAAVKIKEEVQTYVNKVKASADLSSTLIAKGDDEEIVSSQNAVQENVEKVQSEYPRNVRPVHNDEILIYNSESVDTLLMEDVVKKYGDTQDIINYGAMFSTKSNDKKRLKSELIEADRPRVIESSGEQWYESDFGQSLFAKLLQDFERNSVSVEISRHEKSRDMTLELNGKLCLNFPREYPDKEASLTWPTNDGAARRSRNQNEISGRLVERVMRVLRLS